MKKKELYKKVVDTYGVPLQTLVVAEECSELVKVCSKLARSNDNYMSNRENLMEEIADVIIMCEQMIQLYGIPVNRIETYKEQKLQRLAGRLGEIYETD